MRVPDRLRTWLTGPGSDPSVRWRYWREVAAVSETDARVRTARKAIGRKGWAAELLSYQCPDGHWTTPGSTDRELYVPKYAATNWHAIVLADLGMARSDPRIRRTAELIMKRWGNPKDDGLTGPSAEICITGNATRTLLRFGYLEHPVVRRSIDWIVGAQKADGGWHCFRSKRGTLDAWEGLAALAEIPEARRTEPVRSAIARGAEFFLERELMEEGPDPYPPWFRIHYPNHYYYDLLVGLRILSRLGYGGDHRMRPALRWLEERRRPDGTWALDADHPDVDPDLGGYSILRPVLPLRVESPNAPSRWATVEALSVLAQRERS